MIKSYILERMLSNYIFAYQFISFKNLNIVSPATFVNKSNIVLTLEYQKYLRSQLKH